MEKIPRSIGAHVSVSGGLITAIENGERLGATCIQLFGSSPRQWRVKVPDTRVSLEFRARLAQSGIHAVYLHAPYLTNIASDNAFIRRNSIACLIGQMRIAEAIGAVGVIFHVGSAKVAPREKAARDASAAMKEILRRAPGDALLIVENSSGGGGKLAITPEDIAGLINGVGSPRIAACFDTAHAFEAGIIAYDSDATVKSFFTKWAKTVGMSRLVAIHANDSKTEFGSQHDRHENIGEGHIGIKGFRTIASEKRLFGASWILEVPGFDEMGADKKNMQRLRSVFR